jgi:hypothetical protein
MERRVAEGEDTVPRIAAATDGRISMRAPPGPRRARGERIVSAAVDSSRAA